jgi:hydrogenase maturation protease
MHGTVFGLIPAPDASLAGRQMTNSQSIVVAGIGNTLMQDDGIGVWAVRALARDYVLPAQVRLLEGGVLGLQLVHELCSAEQLLVIDAMRSEGAAGTIYRLDGDSLLKARRTYISLHEVSIVEVLSVGEFLGLRPRVRILGVQPLEAAAFGLELTPALQAVLPHVVTAALEELEDMDVAVAKQKHGPSFALS